MPLPLRRLETRCLFTPADLPPSREGFEVVGAFNPAATRTEDGRVAMLVRVAERPAETRDGHVASPRYTADGDVAIDWIDTDRVSQLDPRMVVFKDTGFKRLTFLNHLRLVYLKPDGVTLDTVGPVVDYHAPHAVFGLEDPRIAPLGGRYLVTAAAASFHGVCTVVLGTEDFVNYTDHGIGFCRENKDVVIFPEKINGHHLAIHRPTGKFEVSQPEMWLASSPDLTHWGRHRPLWGSGDTRSSGQTSGGGGWDSGRVGGGVPPIRIDTADHRGWLVIYHASCRPEPGEPIGVYAAGALLLDIDDPARVRMATPDAFMRPEADFERQGFVKAVVFPTGFARDGDDLLLYYGAADTHVGVVRYRLNELLDELVPMDPT
ncbi:MAG: glycosylase [Planctomycetota bacterium]